MVNRTECSAVAYTSRPSFCKSAGGGVFTFLCGKRRFVLDGCLCFAQISEDARELKLAYSCCVVIIRGLELQTIFEDAMKQQLGEVREGGVPNIHPNTGLWIESIQIIDPPGSIEDKAFDGYVQNRKQQLASEPGLEDTVVA
jgi:hypothetical protein